MASQRNALGLTPAAARTLAQAGRWSKTWGVEKRIRTQLACSGLATFEHVGREWSMRLTSRGRLFRSAYREAGLHKVPRTQTKVEVSDEALIAAGDVCQAAADALAFLT